MKPSCNLSLNFKDFESVINTLKDEGISDFHLTPTSENYDFTGIKKQEVMKFNIENFSSNNILEFINDTKLKFGGTQEEIEVTKRNLNLFQDGKILIKDINGNDLLIFSFIVPTPAGERLELRVF